MFREDLIPRNRWGIPHPLLASFEPVACNWGRPLAAPSPCPLKQCSQQNQLKYDGDWDATRPDQKVHWINQELLHATPRRVANRCPQIERANCLFCADVRNTLSRLSGRRAQYRLQHLELTQRVSRWLCQFHKPKPACACLVLPTCDWLESVHAAHFALVSRTLNCSDDCLHSCRPYG